MKYIFNKCLLIIYGIFIAIGLLELGLRIGGYVYLEKNDSPDIKKNAYRILCLGDSFTYGVGAPRDQSYPSQLLALLKIKREDTPVSVINYGYGGQNTSQLLYRLSSDIERLDPHLIILLTGLNNRWNYWGLSDYLKVATVWERVEKHLYCSRVYKLLVVLYHRFNQKMFIGKSKQRENTIKMLEYDSDDEYKIEKYDYDLFKDYRGKGNYLKALTVVRAGLKKDPNKALYYNQLGCIYKSMGQYDQAMYSFLKSVDIDPFDPLPFIEIGWLYKVQKNYTDAIRWFNKALLINAYETNAYHGLGWVYLELAEYEMALQSFHQGLEYNPKDSDCYSGIGTTYMEQGKYDEALQWFSECLKIDEANSLGFYNMGRIYVVKGDFNKAFSWFHKGIEKTPYFGGNYCGIAELFEEQGKYEQALMWYEKGLSVDATFPGLFFGLSRIALKSDTGNKVSTIIRKYGYNNALANMFLAQLEKKTTDNADSKNGIYSWMQSDIKKIIELCRQYDIYVIIQNYPFDAAVNPILERCADEYSVPLVDNYAYFDSLWQRGIKKDTIMAHDGIHCNKKGYAIIADNIYKKIVEENLLDL